ncbi:MAG: amino acid racemase [Fibrobacteria bacterium]|nr:amino acid racemase [Fibrobacteria bacterium]
MKTIGIIGGIGPESTVDYYKEIIKTFQTTYSYLAYPEIIVYSVNMNELMQFVETKNWSNLSELLLDKIGSLHKAGAAFAAIASNTPHIVFDELKTKSPLPLLSIVEETCNKADEMGLKNVGLMGTKLTMEAEFYKKPFYSKGISVVVPSEEEQQLIHHKLFSEIELGIFKDSTKEGLLAIAKRMVEKNGIDSLILGCTELPLILTEPQYNIPFLNTTAIHCESIIAHCIEGMNPVC